MLNAHPYFASVKNKMTNRSPTLRICNKGHKYYKSSDCPTCPICEQERKPKNNFLSELGAPARRALENSGITTLEQLSKLTESDVLKLHGMGPGSIPKLRKLLKESKLSFKNKRK
jgi:DNA-directed RNA polymerase alpha subunit